MRALSAVALGALLIVVGGSDAADQRVKKAEWTLTLLSAQRLDIGTNGPNIGDGTMRRFRMTDRQGSAIGFAYETCHQMTPELRECMTVYTPPTGTIVTGGMVGDGSAQAVMGGTGEYFGARGQAIRRGRVISFAFV